MEKRKIHLGDVFGDLTVIEKLDERIRSGVVWLCSCNCGNSKKVTSDYLNQGWTRSCGCLKSKRARDRLPEIWAVNPLKNQSNLVYKFNNLLRSYTRGAVARGLLFNMSKEQVYSIATSHCHYCGFLPIFKEKDNIKSVNHQSYSTAYNGMDRVDSSIGYKIDNVVPCCKICNIAKNSMSYSQFMEYLDRVCFFRSSHGAS